MADKTVPDKSDSRLAVLTVPEAIPASRPAPYVTLFRHAREYDSEGRVLVPFLQGDVWELTLTDARRIYNDLAEAMREVDRI